MTPLNAYRKFPAQPTKTFEHFCTFCYLPFCFSCAPAMGMLLTRITYEPIPSRRPLCTKHKATKAGILVQTITISKALPSSALFWLLKKFMVAEGGWE